jgi:hypothetical protein
LTTVLRKSNPSALTVTQFDCTNLVQEQIIVHSLHIKGFNSSPEDKQDKVVKLYLTGFTFQYDTAAVAAVLDLPYTRRFLNECGGGGGGGGGDVWAV